jgi:hypothetical protein
VTSRAPARRAPFSTPDLDRAIAETRASTIVVWRGERVPFLDVPERIAAIDGRDERDGLYGSYADALEALNPLHEQRLRAWQSAGPVAELAAGEGSDPVALDAELERFELMAETPYYAALRRYLALIGIEQGDGTEADVWHVVRGSSWRHWFGDVDLGSAVAAVGRGSSGPAPRDGWRAAEHHLAGDASGAEAVGPSAVAAAYRSLAGAPTWLAGELRMAGEEIAPFADFVAFARLWRLRRDAAVLTYELRLFATDDPALQRAYYSGIVGHATGVALAEAGYLDGIERPFASAARLRAEILGGMLVEALELRHGSTWWRDPASVRLVEAVASASSEQAAIAELGYDALDWRPVQRQIRTRLIGEMSGYGGPNITTRAGTRKV